MAIVRVSRRQQIVHVLVAILVADTFSWVRADDDWPMWRYDAYRSAAAPDNHLPQQLQQLWTRNFSAREQAWDDPLNLDLMTYDRVFEPIVMQGRMFVSFNDRDKVVAFDTTNGGELWTAFASGPVRLPPVAVDGRVYFCSDDGCLYCVNATDGKEIWKFRGAPGAQKAIGNQRVISAWPARGGPVVRDGTVYFAASIWPFMGTFIYAINAETGTVEWVNDGTGSQYIKQPHSAPSFAGVAPQGALVATNEVLLVPGGRSVPAAFDRRSGKLRYFEINAGGKGTGGSFVSADEKNYYVHTREKGTRAFSLKSGIKTAFMPRQPVLYNDMIFAAAEQDGQRLVRAYSSDEKQLWQVTADATGDLIMADGHLVAAGTEAISIIRLKDSGGEIVHRIEIKTPVERLLCADRKLFSVTSGGQISAYGDVTGVTPATPREADDITSTTSARQTVKELLGSGVSEGYALWFGRCDSDLVSALYTESPFAELAVVDSDSDAVQTIRQSLDAANLYGAVTVHAETADQFTAPQYIANMVFVDESLSTSCADATLATIYKSVRPYGGVMHLLADSEDRSGLLQLVESLNLEQASVEPGPHGIVVRRVGALPGSADWTHQHGDVANTIKSDDQRVKLPLGVLWFGGSSNMDVLPRHGHGPPEQVVGGRLFIEGMNSLSCRDVYTGRVLWKREFTDLGTFDVYYDATYEDTPLNPKYNQVHIPGANGRGTNFVATEDRVYILEGSICHVLDPVSGETLVDISMPSEDGMTQWGYIGVYGDVLLGGRGFADYQHRQGITLDSDSKLKGNKAGFGTKSFNRAASLGLTAFDRYTGNVLWTFDANHSFWHNGVVAGGGRIYCLDRNPPQLEEIMRRRGLANPESYRLVALDHRTGQIIWEARNDVFGTWLGYSEEFDLLLQAGAAASDRLAGEVSKGMAVYHAANGNVKWRNDTLNYTGPCILHNDLIITNTNSYAESAGAFYLETGKQKLVSNPLTNELQPWKLTRAYGCNNIIASENLLTFRSGAAGYYDLLSDGGTGNLGGFKSGCTSNLVVANGVLNAPDYTRTCSCSYQNQTSLALVHMPGVELWSVNSAASVRTSEDRIEKVALNLGAPGDRRDNQGTLWLEYPVEAGPSPPIVVQMNDDVSYFRRHSSVLADSTKAWVFSSGATNVNDVRINLNLQRSDLESGIPISHADDDAEEDEKGNVNLSSSDLELIRDSGQQLVGLRFNKLPLSRDSVIRNAYIQFTCDEPSEENSTLIIAAEDTGHAERFSGDQHDLSSRTLTSVEIDWRPEAWPKKGGSENIHRTPNLTPLIEEVLRRNDWKPGNSMAFLVSGTGKRTAAAWQNGKTGVPKLVVEADRTAAIPTDRTPERYTVRLYFALPDNKADAVSMGVILQGAVRKQDVVLDADNATAVHEFADVRIADELHIQLTPKSGTPCLSGVEILKSSEVSKAASER